MSNESIKTKLHSGSRMNDRLLLLLLIQFELFKTIIFRSQNYYFQFRDVFRLIANVWSNCDSVDRCEEIMQKENKLKLQEKVREKWKSMWMRRLMTVETKRPESMRDCECLDVLHKGIFINFIDAIPHSVQWNATIRHWPIYQNSSRSIITVFPFIHNPLSQLHFALVEKILSLSVSIQFIFQHSPNHRQMAQP